MVPLYIDEEIVLPGPDLRRPGLYLRHVYLMPLERHENVGKSTGAILDREHNGRLILFCLARLVLAYHEEPCHIMA